MGFYAPPLRDGASAALAPGYVAPTAQQADASLSDAGAFRYRPSSRYAVDATLQPGYTAPTQSACDATLTRPLAEADVLRPAGLDACAFGSQDVRLAQVFLAPAGFDGSELGPPAVRNALERVLAGHRPSTGAELRPGYSPPPCSAQSAQLRRHGDYLEVGHHAIEFDGVDFVAPSGWLSQHFGQQADVRNKSRFVLAGAISPRGAYGTAWVSHYTRYLTPPGADTQAHGSQWASHWLRYVTSPGVGDKTARGTPWVSRSPRTLEPAGPDMMRVFEAHTVGGTRYIEPVGTEMTEWGTRIIPEGQVAYPEGFAGEVGAPDVQLLTRYLTSQGFVTYSDLLRFGWGDVWNLRQIVRQDYDPNDGLNPPDFGHWTLVENRNKEPVPVGWLSERHGYTFIWNKATPVLPAGIAVPENDPFYKAGSVTHWERSIYPDPLDSFASDRWHNLTNTADLIHPVGVSEQAFGQHDLENRSRQYKDVGNFDTMALGTPMLADRVREITFESRYSIEPPPIALPDVKLHTRYVEWVSAGDRLGAGVPDVVIRWTIIEPKWAFHPPAWIGEPALHNVTPELRTGGANHEAFGDAAIRTQWRRVETRESYMTQFGQQTIRDRRSWVEFVSVGNPPLLVPGPVVTKVGGLPDPQNVTPSGIAPTPRIEEQVPKPTLNLLFAYPEGFDSAKFGQTVVTANSIRVEPGYWDHLIGEPAVTLKNRVLAVAEWPQAEVFQPSKAAVSPHTIYAVVEAPEQAKENHGRQQLHYVDHAITDNRSLKGPGSPTVTHKHRFVKPSGFAWLLWAQPAIHNTRHSVLPNGLHSQRFGIPSVPSDRTLEQFDSQDAAAWGRPTVAPPPYVGPRYLNAAGIGAPTNNGHEVDFLHRERAVQGWHSLQMGGPKSGDTPYQWQGLRIGPLMPTIPTGFTAEQWGTAWVSLRVRDVAVESWESFECDYEPGRFNRRMKVWRVKPDPAPPVRLYAQGIEPGSIGTPDASVMRHYIRPDGNAEQYRKGAPS